MIIIGVTGGIAAGKSTVSTILQGLGAEIIDADIISREAVCPGKEAYKKIMLEFGDTIANKDTTIDRQKLGEIVFNDKKKLKILEQIIHPEVIKEQERRLVALQKAQSHTIAVVDAALLIEAGFHKRVDILMVVSAEEEVQITRLFLRNRLTERESRQRISAQMPISKKAALADYLIENNGTLADLESKVVAIYSKIKATLIKNK